jgi:hypothetical protein
VPINPAVNQPSARTCVQHQGARIEQLVDHSARLAYRTYLASDRLGARLQQEVLALDQFAEVDRSDECRVDGTEPDEMKVGLPPRRTE